jgi:hypothetical protein
MIDFLVSTFRFFFCVALWFCIPPFSFSCSFLSCCFFSLFVSIFVLLLFLTIWSYETIDMYDEHFVARTSGTRSPSIYLKPVEGVSIYTIFIPVLRDILPILSF